MNRGFEARTQAAVADIGAQQPRLPFADAVWIMDPNLVFVGEAGIQIKVPVADQLRERVKAWVTAAIPEKITVEGCSFQPEMEIWFEGRSVQAKAEILQQSYEELVKYLDVPAYWRGDLYYIDNLCAAIEAAE